MPQDRDGGSGHVPCHKTAMMVAGMCHATREVLFAFLKKRNSSFLPVTGH